MTLIIDTSDNNIVRLFLEKDNKILKKKLFSASRRQSERLLPAIDSFLKSNDFCLKDIKKIKVVNKGDSFTSLRIGVLTANALAYALGIRVDVFEGKNTKVKKLKDFNIVIPDYNYDPDIKIKKNELD